MKNKICIFFGFCLFFSCCGMNEILHFKKFVKKPDIHIKCAIATGNLDYFKQYCRKRHELGIDGRKDNNGEQFFVGGKYGYDLIFANTNLFFQICSSQHENSEIMLKNFLTEYCGYRDYTLKNHGHQFILKIFNECEIGDKAQEKLALEKLHVLLDKLELLQHCKIPLDRMEEILNNVHGFGFFSSKLHNRFKKFFQKNIMHSLKNACDCSNRTMYKLEKFLSFSKQHTIDVLSEGNQLLLNILNTDEKSDEDVYVAVEKMKVLCEYGAFMPWQNNEVAKEILEKVENFDEKTNNKKVKKEAFFLYFKFKEKYDAYLRDYNDDIVGTLINNKVIDKNCVYGYANLYRLF